MSDCLTSLIGKCATGYYLIPEVSDPEVLLSTCGNLVQSRISFSSNFLEAWVGIEIVVSRIYQAWIVDKRFIREVQHPLGILLGEHIAYLRHHFCVIEMFVDETLVLGIGAGGVFLGGFNAL